MQVVVFDEQDVFFEFWQFGYLGDFVDDFLVWMVGWVSFVGEQEKYWLVGLVDDFVQLFWVLQQQGGVFVGGEVVGEVDGQDIGVVWVGVFEQLVEVGW